MGITLQWQIHIGVYQFLQMSQKQRKWRKNTGTAAWKLKNHQNQGSIEIYMKEGPSLKFLYSSSVLCCVTITSHALASSRWGKVLGWLWALARSSLSWWVRPRKHYDLQVHKDSSIQPLSYFVPGPGCWCHRMIPNSLFSVSTST